jgi:hypothetical protein
MWFSLSSDGITEQSYGFAPISHGIPVGGGQVYQNDLDTYASYAYVKSIFITQAQYDAVRSFAENPTSKNFSMAYDIFRNSCVDFVYEALRTFSNTLGDYDGRLWPMDNIQDRKFIAVIEEMKTRDAVDPVPQDSAGYVTVSVEKSAAEALLGHPFDPKSAQDAQEISEAMDSGELIYALGYAPTEGTSRYTTPFDGMGSDKIVVSSSKSNNAVSVIEGGNIKRITQDNSNGSGKDTLFDPNNTHPYAELDVTKGADGKVTAAQVTLDPNVLAAGMSIGQIFGSALGGALGGNSLVGNLASSTIGGLIGQKFVQVLATSMTADLSTISLNDVFASQGISVANAGIGAVSSFLTAELGHALHIDGFDGQLFNTAVSGFTTSLLIQVTDKMARGSLDFAGAIAAMDWTQAVSGAIDVAQINLGNLLGGYLGHELVPAQTREGAIGGQLFGAIGGFILREDWAP